MRKGDETRAKLIEITADLVQRQGLRATGLNQIIAESGAPRGSLYHHFKGGKEELAAAALASAAIKWRAELQDYMASKGPAAEAMLACCKTLGFRLKESNFQLGCPLATTTLELVDASDEPIRDVCSLHYQNWESFMAALIAREGHDDERARVLAVICLAAIEGALLLSRAHKSTKPMRDVGAHLFSLLDLGAGAPSTAQAEHNKPRTQPRQKADKK